MAEKFRLRIYVINCPERWVRNKDPSKNPGGGSGVGWVPSLAALNSLQHHLVVVQKNKNT